MKRDTHPAYNEVKIVCSCGNQFTTGSTSSRKELHLDVCSSCHPFYTGKQKMVDTGGRVQHFNKKFAGILKSKRTGDSASA